MTTPAQAPARPVSGLAGADSGTFPARDPAGFGALSWPARRTFLALHDLAPGGVYGAGQAALAAMLGKVPRSVQRAVAELLAGGFVRERRGGPGEPATLVLHPRAGLFAAAGRRLGEGWLARPAETGLPLVPPSVALACARARRPDGSLFVAAPYLVDLMTPAEIDACSLAVAAGAERLCADAVVSAALVAWFRRRAAHTRFRAVEWAGLALRAPGRRGCAA